MTTEGPQPSTFGGPGFRYRTKQLDDNLSSIWTPCGTRSETTTLQQVTLAVPGQEMNQISEPDKWLFLQSPDLHKMQDQQAALAELYTSLNIHVHHVSHPSQPPNWIFQRDLFFCAPDGIILSRPASVQRAGEERLMQQSLSQIGVPIKLSPCGNALFEGADALWLTPQLLMLGIGVRSNQLFAEQLANFLSHNYNIKLLTGPLPEDIQHLLGVVNFVSHGRAAIWKDKTPKWIVEALREQNYEILMMTHQHELKVGRAMNWVCVHQNGVVMPSDCPNTQRQLNQAGVETYVTDISEYRKAGGAMGCLTGILHREK